MYAHHMTVEVAAKDVQIIAQTIAMHKHQHVLHVPRGNIWLLRHLQPVARVVKPVPIRPQRDLHHVQLAPEDLIAPRQD